MNYRWQTLLTTLQKFAGAITFLAGYYNWLLSFRAFLILTGKITGGYLYLQHYQKFAGAITILGG